MSKTELGATLAENPVEALQVRVVRCTLIKWPANTKRILTNNKCVFYQYVYQPHLYQELPKPPLS
jgi:hypothetical protein